MTQPVDHIQFNTDLIWNVWSLCRVTLSNFGFLVVIADIMIPACSELSSLSIDYSKRLCVSTNVYQNSILLNELQTPVVCQYEKLYEDNHCHYSMSIGKLRELLNEIQFPSDNIGHLKMMQFNLNENNDLSTRIKSIYKECLDYQFQLNLTAQLIKRIIWCHKTSCE